MSHIHIIEVGARDGLQNVPQPLSVDQRENLIRYLVGKGFQNVEAGSFVRGDKVPQMAGSDEICTRLADLNDKLWYLVPNLKGLEAALKVGARNLAFFTAASEAFNKKNIGMNVEESLKAITQSATHLKENGYELEDDWNAPLRPNRVKARLYVSTVIGCPYDGAMNPDRTAVILDALLPLGFAQVSLGDTLGVGVPKDWKKLLGHLNQHEPSLFTKDRLAIHCHDTYATSLACVNTGLDMGITAFDSSIGGLGGCPFAPGASGNLATEDLAYFLEKEGFKTDVKPADLLDVFDPSRTGTLSNRSRVWAALKPK